MMFKVEVIEAGTSITTQKGNNRYAARIKSGKIVTLLQALARVQFDIE